MPSERIPRSYTTHDAAIDDKIADLSRVLKDPQDQQLLRDMMISAYRFGMDGASTGDLKLVNAALKELRYAFRVFAPYRHIRKVALFGSARVSKEHPAYGLAKEFGHLMAKAGWMVITGAASGIMKAGHEGAGQTASFGLNIRLPFEQEANIVIAKDTKLVNCKYFFTRKLLFIKESHATALFPGGFGTLDEGFETLTLLQTGKTDPRPIVFVETPKKPFWKPLLNFFDRQLIHERMISEDDRSIYDVAATAEEAAEQVLRFYSMYHSLRYVGDELIIRLNRALPADAPAQLTKQFSDILAKGAIVQGRPVLGEADEPELSHLPRLVMHFNRQRFGRLIQLIHSINDFAH